MGWEIVDVLRDSSYFFSAVSEALDHMRSVFETLDHTKSVTVIRRESLANSNEWHISFLNESRDSYVYKVSQSKEFADNIVIQLMADTLNHMILIVSSQDIAHYREIISID